MYVRFGKRIIDVGIAFLVLLFSLPICIIISCCLAITNKGKILFTQKRLGWKGKSILIYKFKTMSDAVDANGELKPDEERLSDIGKWMRRTSLDELPQLYNVLRGDLSLVGPRPLLMEYLPLYSEEQARRHEVKPGITGWAQVHGRNNIPWEQKLALDVWYADHISFRIDMAILYKSIQTVVSGTGVNAAGFATMPKFKGQKSESWEVTLTGNTSINEGVLTERNAAV